MRGVVLGFFPPFGTGNTLYGLLVQRVLVTADLPSWDLRTYTTHRGYPIGPAELRARSDYSQTANPHCFRC